MPENTTRRTPANGTARPVAEKAPEKVVETTRRYVREAEKFSEDALRVYNELVSTTTNYYFDTLDKTVRGTMDITTRAEHALEEMMTVYRKSYMDGIKSWEGYWQDVNKMFTRPR